MSKILYPLVSTAQTFSDDQKSQARSNIGAIAHSDLLAPSTSKTIMIDTSVGQKELAFDVVSGKNALRIFDVYADLSGTSVGTPLIEVIGGGTVLNSFYAYVPAPVTGQTTTRFKLCSVADASKNLSSITVRINYGAYLLNGGNFSVTMSEAYL